MPDTLVMKEKESIYKKKKKKKRKKKERKYRGKQKVKSIGHVIGGNELILKTSLKNIQHF